MLAQTKTNFLTCKNLIYLQYCGSRSQLNIGDILEHTQKIEIECPVVWREIFMKQSVGKCKQIKF